MLYKVSFDGSEWLIIADSFQAALSLWHSIVAVEWGEDYKEADQPESLELLSKGPIYSESDFRHGSED